MGYENCYFACMQNLSPGLLKRMNLVIFTASSDHKMFDRYVGFHPNVRIARGKSTKLVSRKRVESTTPIWESGGSVR
jgi:hypothetical protein